MTHSLGTTPGKRCVTPAILVYEFPRVGACTRFGSDEETPEQENAQDHDDGDYDDLDQAHNQVLKS